MHSPSKSVLTEYAVRHFVLPWESDVPNVHQWGPAPSRPITPLAGFHATTLHPNPPVVSPANPHTGLNSEESHHHMPRSRSTPSPSPSATANQGIATPSGSLNLPNSGAIRRVIIEYGADSANETDANIPASSRSVAAELPPTQLPLGFQPIGESTTPIGTPYHRPTAHHWQGQAMSNPPSPFHAPQPMRHPWASNMHAPQAGDIPLFPVALTGLGLSCSPIRPEGAPQPHIPYATETFPRPDEKGSDESDSEEEEEEEEENDDDGDESSDDDTGPEPLPTMQSPPHRHVPSIVPETTGTRGILLSDECAPPFQDGSPIPGQPLHRDLTEIQWDIREPSTTARITWNDPVRRGRPVNLGAKASTPNINRVVVRFILGHLSLLGGRLLQPIFDPYPPIILTAAKSDVDGGSPITVGKILDTLRDWFLTELTGSELHSVNSQGLLYEVCQNRAGGQLKSALKNAMRKPVQAGQPLRRVDLLANGHSTFVGFVCEAQTPRTGSLYLAFEL